MSGIEGSANASSSQSPAGPFAPHLALPNHVLRSGAGPTQLRTRSLSCGMILLCDLSRRAAASIPSPSLRVGPLPCHAAERSNIRKLVGTVRRHEEGAPRRDEVPRGGECVNSQWLRCAMRNRSTGTAKRRGWVGPASIPSSRFIEAERRPRGPAGGREGDTKCSPQPPTCVSVLSSREKISNKFILFFYSKHDN